VFLEIMFSRWSLHQGNELQQRAEQALAEAADRAEMAKTQNTRPKRE
jgi:hypothetical protein